MGGFEALSSILLKSMVPVEGFTGFFLLYGKIVYTKGGRKIKRPEQGKVGVSAKGLSKKFLYMYSR